ncbi:MAG TPA: hypothetical protein VMN37_08435 [Gemmatimonadales bacterium]|nr:hypothetical protein [Gemmatimonadales bacterium]
MRGARRWGWAGLLAGSVWAAPAAAQGAPADSTLAGACAGGGGVAEGLLVVVFRPDVTPERRAALVSESGGTLAGPAEAGGYYITLPPEGFGSADATADRLIRLDGVTSVGGTACPPPPPPPVDTVARPDTAAAADTVAPAGTAAPADTAARGDSPAPAAPPPAGPAAVR